MSYKTISTGSHRDTIAMGLTAWTAALAALALLAPSALAAEGACGNEARRAEQASTYLANCRAYEQITPAAKDSGEPRATQVGLTEREIFVPVRGAQAAADGGRMAWSSEDFLPVLAGPSSPGFYYLATRGSAGWSTEATIPPQSPENGLVCAEEEFMAGWSDDLTRGILADGDSQEREGGNFFEQAFGCGHDEPRLVEGEPEELQNLFVRDSETRSYQLANVTPRMAPRPTPKEREQQYFPPSFQAGSADLSHVVFEDELPLTEAAEHLTQQGAPVPGLEEACEEAPKGRACWEGHDDLYLWSEGQQPAVRLVTVLPSGKPVEGALAGSTRNALSIPTNVAGYRHAVSADGSRIFFEAEGTLYVRENGGQPQSAIAPGSTAVNGDQCTEPAKACTIQLDASQGGSGTGGGKWLSASEDGARVFFTDESDLTKAATAIAEEPDLYEYDFEAPQGERLKDLTLDPTEPADVRGLSGTSEDGSYAYFVAEGQLVAGKGTSGQPNLYVSHEGATTFIATLSTDDLCDWTSNTGCNLEEPSNPTETGLTARVSGSGRSLAFNSVDQLTGYDNVGPGCVELHGPQRFTAGACEEIFLYEAEGNHLACVSCNSNGAPNADGAALDYPAPAANNASVTAAYPQHNVSEAGQVFFETSEALLPPDTNGARDVYEYEHGALHLISSGTSEPPSYFMDATPSGGDVFLATAQPLLRSDTDAVYDVYDARIGGGFPEPAASASPCSGEPCREPAVTVPALATPGSASLAGGGNLTAAAPATPAKPKTAAQIRAGKLARALKVCRARYKKRERANKHKRTVCESRARKKYGPSKAKKSAGVNRSNGR